MAQRTLNSS